MCDQIDSFPRLLDDLEVDASEGVKNKLLEIDVKYQKQRYVHYRGHQTRLAHEGQAQFHIKRRLRDDTSLIAITAD